MTDALPLRIFLASPSDVADERETVRTCVEEHNRRHADDDVARFEVVGWERVRGTARRPQEAINELIGECHFLVAVFRRSWGSEPGSPWGYTSGTEEELFAGLLDLGVPEQPMRDVWVGFLDDPSRELRLEQLREQMASRHSLMYEALSDRRDLKVKLAERLESWAATATYKVARQVDLLPSTGRDVLRAANLRSHGEKLVELGQPGAGRDALKEAAALGGPEEQLAYSRFLARNGDLEEAYAATQRAIEYFSTGERALYSPAAAEAFAAQAGVLRQQGRDLDAIGRLDGALTLLGSEDSSDSYTERVRCKVLDELGLAHQRVEHLELARQSFERALRSRRNSGTVVKVAQSLINLSRLEVKVGNLTQASEYVDEVLDLLASTPPGVLRANAETLAAQVRLRLGAPLEGVPHANWALSLNRQVGNRHGIAISLLLLAQCYKSAGMKDEALAAARECIEVNASMGNRTGVERAQWIIDQVEK